MKSRFTIAMITVGGLLNLGLVAFLTNGVHERHANAQGTTFSAQGATPVRELGDADSAHAGPAIAAPAFYGTNQTQPAGTTRYGQSLNGQTYGYVSQPSTRLSVSSSQPIVVAIKDGPQLSGDTVNLGAFQFKTIFGMVAIPVDTITGLRMAHEPHQPATICLSNGDSLTGTLVTDSITIKTAWGGATIGRDQIVSIVTTSEPVTWQQHEGRWRIIFAEPVTSGAEAADTNEHDDKRYASDAPSPIDSEATPTSSTFSPFQPAADPGIDSEN